ncbi:LacI family DNA-binding transcriptional regulator [Bauldia sp.]|uniref:LacI family DNA-binding transcriptional regulator n=1 Tax=Bauldia sp. TaxID=2575872 RepID=UPI003BA9111D
MRDPINGDRQDLKRAPTLADVAKRSGVAPATVSRALNTPSLVREPTRARIMEAVTALGYYANPAARALAGSPWRTVGVIAPSLDHAMFHHQLSIFEQEMAARDVLPLISASNYDSATELRLVDSLLARGVDGVLLTHVDRPDLVFDVLQTRGVPVVVMSSLPDERAIWIGYDELDSMSPVVDHLYGLGHRSFAIVGDARAAVHGRARIAAVRKRLSDLAVELSPNRVIRCGFDPKDARAALRKLMTLEPKPTAIVCGNDWLALSVLAEADESGLKVPYDISVTGFDDIDLAGHPRLSLTTVKVPWRELGRAAAETLHRAILGRSVGKQVFRTSLMVRQSTGSPD